MAGRVAKKVSLITGGGAGIGKACCEVLAEEGAIVVITDVDAESGEALAEEIRGKGQQASFIAQDVTKEEDWDRVIGHIEKEFGQLDVIVNNAGVVIPKTMEDTSLEEWRWLMSINLDGVFVGTKKAAASMRRTGTQGSIINMCSIEGIIGEPLCPAYNASKGGVRTFTKCAALDCAPDKIRVNSVHPGYILTPLIEGSLAKMEDGGKAFKEAIEAKHPLGHMGEPMDVAYGVLYLASDESKFCTGSELIMDGGYLAQ